MAGSALYNLSVRIYFSCHGEPTSARRWIIWTLMESYSSQKTTSSHILSTKDLKGFSLQFAHLHTLFNFDILLQYLSQQIQIIFVTLQWVHFVLHTFAFHMKYVLQLPSQSTHCCMQYANNWNILLCHDSVLWTLTLMLLYPLQP